MLAAMATEDELLKAGKRLFSAFGSAVKTAGTAAKKAGQQVTGVGRGSVKIEVDRTRYAPGDDVRGKVTIDPSEPIDAKKLIVTLRATQRTIDRRSVGGTTTATVYEQTRELGGARRYDKETIDFAVPIPKDAGERAPSAPGGKLGDVARAVSSVVGPTTGPVEWRLTASLVISFGRDLEHTVDLVVG